MGNLLLRQSSYFLKIITVIIINFYFWGHPRIFLIAQQYFFDEILTKIFENFEEVLRKFYQILRNIKKMLGNLKKSLRKILNIIEVILWNYRGILRRFWKNFKKFPPQK